MQYMDGLKCKRKRAARCVQVNATPSQFYHSNVAHLNVTGNARAVEEKETWQCGTCQWPTDIKDAVVCEHCVLISPWECFGCHKLLKQTLPRLSFPTFSKYKSGWPIPALSPAEQEAKQKREAHPKRYGVLEQLRWTPYKERYGRYPQWNDLSDVSTKKETGYPHGRELYSNSLYLADAWTSERRCKRDYSQWNIYYSEMGGAECVRIIYYCERCFLTLGEIDSVWNSGEYYELFDQWTTWTLSWSFLLEPSLRPELIQCKHEIRDILIDSLKEYWPDKNLIRLWLEWLALSFYLV
jgi:hypothetical protein